MSVTPNSQPPRLSDGKALVCVFKDFAHQANGDLCAEWAWDSLVRSKFKFMDSSLRAGLGLSLLPVSVPFKLRGPKDPDLGPVRARPGVRCEGRRLSGLLTSFSAC